MARLFPQQPGIALAVLHPEIFEVEVPDPRVCAVLQAAVELKGTFSGFSGFLACLRADSGNTHASRAGTASLRRVLRQAFPQAAEPLVFGDFGRV